MVGAAVGQVKPKRHVRRRTIAASCIAGRLFGAGVVGLGLQIPGEIANVTLRRPSPTVPITISRETAPPEVYVLRAPPPPNVIGATPATPLTSATPPPTPAVIA